MINSINNVTPEYISDEVKITPIIKRKITIKGDIVYGDRTSSDRVLSESSFTVGEYDSISNMLEEIIEQFDHNTIAVKEGARFFNLEARFSRFTITFTNEDGSTHDEIEFTTQKEVENSFSSILAICCA